MQQEYVYRRPMLMDLYGDGNKNKEEVYTLEDIYKEFNTPLDYSCNSSSLRASNLLVMVSYLNHFYQ